MSPSDVVLHVHKGHTADLMDATVDSNGGSQTEASTGKTESSAGKVDPINLPAGTQPVAEQTHLSPQASSVVSGVTPQGYPVYPPLHPALGAPGASTSQLAAPISSGAAPQGVYHPSHMAFSATGATTSHTASHISSGVMPHGYPVYQNVYPAPGAAGTSTPLQASQASTGYPAYPSIHTALGATGVTYTALGATGVMSTAGGNPAQQVVHAGLGAQGNQQWYPYGSGNHVQSPRDSVTSTSSGIQTKRPFLPTFSGERADWPEFKFAWRALAEQQYGNKILLALELKKACSKGRATNSIRHLAVTSDRVYDELWSRLSEEYDDQGLSVQAALNRLFRVNAVTEKDYKGIVEYIDVVEGVHNELRELSQLEAISMVDVDRLSHLLPHAMHIDWMKKFRDLPEAEKIRPFAAFVRFLRSERAYLARLAESTVHYRKQNGSHDAKRPGAQKPSVGSHSATGQSPSVFCVLHGNNHNTKDCNIFKKLRPFDREKAVREKRACFRCFGRHMRRDCTATKLKCDCDMDHHPMVCRGNRPPRNDDRPMKKEAHGANSEEKVDTETFIVRSGTMALYPIQRAYVVGCTRPVTVFMDGGSNASYITESCADRLKLKRVNKVTLDVTTVGGNQQEYNSCVYEIPLRVSYTQVKTILAYSLKEITGQLSPLDLDILRELFPGSDPSALARPSTSVDILIGTDYFGLHPKCEVARAGEHLSIMQGELGACLVGTHPKLKETTRLSKNVPKSLNSTVCRTASHATQLLHPAFDRPDAFILGEEIGTACSPKCGSCKCGKCPIPGHSLSFKEEQELHLIRSNLEHDEAGQYWIAGYPWLVDPNSLPDNKRAAMATLKSTERSLAKDAAWATSYREQVQEMIERGAARRLSTQEIEDWHGPVYYICHLAVSNPKSNSTPVRIVFNSSQIYQGVSLNGCLAKGPDSYRNDILPILMRWREEPVAIVGDIKKMFHSVHLRPLEQHCHRFLWRDLDCRKDPEVYVMTRVNMGDRPAPAIATEALFGTAEKYKDESPHAAKFITDGSYVDDLIDSVSGEARALAQETDALLAKGGFTIKCWRIGGESDPPAGRDGEQSATVTSQAGTENSLKGDENTTGVLGLKWNHKEDHITYSVALNFSKKKRGARTEENLKRHQVPDCLPQQLTRRMVLQQVMSLYDPLGLLSPFTLLAKIYLRETWLLKLDWDDPLPDQMYRKWVEYFGSMFEIEKLEFPRCLRPTNAVGDPWLVILSDGSDEAYGCVAYARWACNDGSVKMNLIMAKARIAPVDRVSTPRMELNGAVISKRCRILIAREMRYKFTRVLHLVDSETVLNMLHKTSSRFKVYEGVRVGEIQAATGGDMSEWAWIPGIDNIADWLTRGRQPGEIDAQSEWFSGPAMLLRPFEEWNVKFGKTSDGPVEGEKKLKTHTAGANEKKSLIAYKNISTYTKAVRVMARVLNMFREKSFQGGQTELLNTDIINEAETLLLKEAQSATDMTSPDYQRLNPAKKADGVWVVGAARLANHNPMSGIRSDLPIFLPKHHPLALLAMQGAHRRGHRGRDATLASFRSRFWTPTGPALASTVRSQCQLCKLRDGQLMEQQMGSLPTGRLMPSPPFNATMVDLFGPYKIRGEVQKRTSGKAWGVLFTDMVSRAVHIEVAFGYDTSSFLMALTNFASIRGWPERIYSDPGTQMTAASKEINAAAAETGTLHGMTWVIGPPDSPWHQGAVESLVCTVKRALKFAMADHRLSAAEFMTVCKEAANLVNERPLGLQPSLDSDINVLTPNCLLLGRATSKNPCGWQPGSPSLKTRYQLVNSISDQFWRHWVQLFAPSLVYRSKWHTPRRDLKVGDVVNVKDSNTLRGDYRMAIVTDVHPGADGRVRSATVAYKNFKCSESPRTYGGAGFTTVRRSVQRLVLLVSVDEAGSGGERSASPKAAAPAPEE